MFNLRKIHSAHEPMEFDGDLDEQFVTDAQGPGWAVAAVIAAVALALVLGFFVASVLGADALATCQLTHSFDACFAALEG